MTSNHAISHCPRRGRTRRAAVGVSPAGSVSLAADGLRENTAADRVGPADRLLASAGEVHARPGGAPIGRFGQYPKKPAVRGVDLDLCQQFWQ